MTSINDDQHEDAGQHRSSGLSRAALAASSWVTPGMRRWPSRLEWGMLKLQIMRRQLFNAKLSRLLGCAYPACTADMASEQSEGSGQTNTCNIDFTVTVTPAHRQWSYMSKLMHWCCVHHHAGAPCSCHKSRCTTPPQQQRHMLCATTSTQQLHLAPAFTACSILM